LGEIADIEKVRIVLRKKFLWDGEEYESDEKAVATEKDYREKGFEVQRVSAGAKVLLYTRRVVTATKSS
jgi:hypothetical protein